MYTQEIKQQNKKIYNAFQTAYDINKDSFMLKNKLAKQVIGSAH